MMEKLENLRAGQNMLDVLLDERKDRTKMKKWPLWRRELHAWRSGRHHAVVTMPERVDPALSLLREHLVPCGLEALRAGMTCTGK